MVAFAECEREAVPSIVEITDFLKTRPGGAILAGLEHMDERYVRAVGYATKAKRHGRPKMVLIGDIVIVGGAGAYCAGFFI